MNINNKEDLLGSLRKIFIEDIESKEELPIFNSNMDEIDSFNNTEKFKNTLNNHKYLDW